MEGDYLNNNFTKTQLRDHCREHVISNIWVTKDVLIDMILESKAPPPQHPAVSRPADPLPAPAQRTAALPSHPSHANRIDRPLTAQEQQSAISLPQQTQAAVPADSCPVQAQHNITPSILQSQDTMPAEIPPSSPSSVQLPGILSSLHLSDSSTLDNDVRVTALTTYSIAPSPMNSSCDDLWLTSPLLGEQRPHLIQPSATQQTPVQPPTTQQIPVQHLLSNIHQYSHLLRNRRLYSHLLCNRRLYSHLLRNRRLYSHLLRNRQLYCQPLLQWLNLGSLSPRSKAMQCSRLPLCPQISVSQMKKQK